MAFLLKLCLLSSSKSLLSLTSSWGGSAKEEMVTDVFSEREGPCPKEQSPSPRSGLEEIILIWDRTCYTLTVHLPVVGFLHDGEEGHGGNHDHDNTALHTGGDGVPEDCGNAVDDIGRGKGSQTLDGPQDADGKAGV